MKVTVYTQDNCQQCNATKRTLDKYGVPYTAELATNHLDVVAWAKQEGMGSAPVVMVHDVTGQLVAAWSGFRPDKIKEVVCGRSGT